MIKIVCENDDDVGLRRMEHGAGGGERRNGDDRQDQTWEIHAWAMKHSREAKLAWRDFKEKRRSAGFLD